MRSTYSRKQDLTGVNPVLAIGLVLGLIVGAVALSSLILQVLWNIVVPGIFGGPALDFPQAVALTLFISVIRSFLK